MKNGATNWHAIGGFVAFLVVSGGALYMGLPMPQAVSLGGTALAVGVGLGLFQAADAQRAERIGTELLPVIDKVKEDLMSKHAENAQNIAVHAAQLEVVVPAVIAASPVIIPPQMKPADDKPDLVEG